MEATDTAKRAVATLPPRYTDHAMLIVWGQFARHFGLISALTGVR